ncbi:MAG: hypothetical protein R3F31_23030 [Verrucomicrobiales bacterium]
MLYLERPGGVSPDRQADVINAVSRLNRAHDTAVTTRNCHPDCPV